MVCEATAQRSASAPLILPISVLLFLSFFHHISPHSLPSFFSPSLCLHNHRIVNIYYE